MVIILPDDGLRMFERDEQIAKDSDEATRDADEKEIARKNDEGNDEEVTDRADGWT